jgi:hypothetical protein
MNVKSLITANYEKWTLGHIGQTNPILSRRCPRRRRNKANFPKKPKMNVNSSITMNYEQQTMNCLTKTNPISKHLHRPIWPKHALIDRMNMICCNCGLTLAPILPKWHYGLIIQAWKMRFENPNLLKNKRLSAQGCLGPPIGTSFANHNLRILSIP